MLKPTHRHTLDCAAPSFCLLPSATVLMLRPTSMRCLTTEHMLCARTTSSAPLVCVPPTPSSMALGRSLALRTVASCDIQSPEISLNSRLFTNNNKTR